MVLLMEIIILELSQEFYNYKILTLFFLQKTGLISFFGKIREKIFLFFMLMEKNFSKKNPLEVDIRTALVYPNEYKIAMSNLGYQIIYNILNDRQDTYCERFIYQYLRSLETGSPLSDFNIIAFSLQYEEDYFNMVKILNDSNIPLNKEDRLKGKHPLIIAGGPCASSNPSVISDFIDIFIYISSSWYIINYFCNIFNITNLI